MQVQNSTNNPNFTSRLNPIKPFKIPTKQGELYCAEIPVADLWYRNEAMEAISDFFCRNFASFTNDPSWLAYNHPRSQAPLRSGFANYLRTKMRNDDGNLTMLLALDKEGRLRGACESRGFDDIPMLKDKVLLIDNIAVDAEYRGSGVGKKMLDKTVEINKDAFTDVFLTGEVMATGFYEKQGFKIMSKANPKENLVVRMVASFHPDYPDYVNLFTKPIQTDKPRWFEFLNSLFAK